MSALPLCFVAVTVAGLEEPLWQQRGFGDICHFSEHSLGCVSGGEGPWGRACTAGEERREVDS